MIPQQFTKDEITSIKRCPVCNTKHITRYFLGKKINEIRISCKNGHMNRLYVYNFNKIGRGVYSGTIKTNIKKITDNEWNKCFALFKEITKLTGIDLGICQGFVKSPDSISFELDDKYRWEMIGNYVVPFTKV